MIIWGWKTEYIDTGFTKHHTCSKCGLEQDFNVLLKYKYGHLFFIFGWLKEKEYIMKCSSCSNIIQLDSNALGIQTANDPIPFMKKKGWIFIFAYLIGILALVITGVI